MNKEYLELIEKETEILNEENEDLMPIVQLEDDYFDNNISEQTDYNYEQEWEDESVTSTNHSMIGNLPPPEAGSAEVTKTDRNGNVINDVLENIAYLVTFIQPITLIIMGASFSLISLFVKLDKERMVYAQGIAGVLLSAGLTASQSKN